MEADILQVGEVVFIVALNCIIIFILYTLQKNSLEKRIKHLKQEVQDLEDLVAAIIEEFEEIAEMTEAKITVAQNTVSGINLIEASEPEMKANIDSPASDDSLEIIPENNRPEVNPATGVQSIQPLEQAEEAQVVLSPKSEYHRPVSDPKHQRILDLWQDGISIEEIAKQLGTGRGEVQLILGIYRRS